MRPVTSSQVLARTPEAAAARYSLLLTTDPAEVLAAQRLRHQVFAGELGAVLDTRRPGVDEDRFDAFCDHLLVREEATGAIVGTYRVLAPARARAAGALYTDGEFDLTALAPLRRRMVETGRTCVHPEHRSGAVVGLVWAGIGRYMVLTGNRWLIGCASVSLGEGGAPAASVWEQARQRHLSPEAYRVRPWQPWQIPAGPAPRLPVPALLRGYLRLGAWVCGPPAHDPAFGCADFPVLLDVHGIDERYARYFLGGRP